MGEPYLWSPDTPEPGADGYYVVKCLRGDPVIARWDEVDADVWEWVVDGEGDVDDAVAWAPVPDDADFTPGEPPIGELAIIAYTVNGEPRIVVDRFTARGINHYAEDGGDPDAAVVITGWHPLPSETP